MEVSYLEALDENSLYKVLTSLRPSEYKQLTISSTILNGFILFNKHRLLKYWSKDRRSLEELKVVLPNFTMEQLNYMADYHRPIEYKSYYPDLDIFNNALRDGNVELGRELFKPFRSYILSAYIHGYPEFIASDTRIASALAGEFYDQDLGHMLGNKYSSLEMFLDVIYRIHINDPGSVEFIVNIISTPTPINNSVTTMMFGLFNASNHPEVVKFCNKVGVEYKPETDVVKILKIAMKYISFGNIIGTIYHTNILSLVENNDVFRLSSDYYKIMVLLSWYDSSVYPSYDLFHDIASGNHVDMFAKSNNWKIDITLTRDRANTHNLLNNYPYIGWTGEQSKLDSQVKLLNNQFGIVKARSTTGKIMLDKHPAIANNYLNNDDLQVEPTRDNYAKLMNRWCFPFDAATNYDSMTIIPQMLACYYHPTLVLGKWRGDISVIVDRCLELGESSERILLYLRNVYNNDNIHLVRDSMCDIPNIGICLYVHGLHDTIKEFISILRQLDINKLSNELRRGISSIKIMFDNLESSYDTIVVSMILNHTYLTAEEKLMFLSKSNSLNMYLINGLSGDVSNDMISIAGGIMNMILDESLVRPLVEKHGSTYVKKLQQVPYLDQNMRGITRGSLDLGYFPLGLIWRETNIFRKTNSYVDDYITLFSKLPKSDIPLINDMRYDEYLQTITANYPQRGITCASKYGYTLLNPFK